MDGLPAAAGSCARRRRPGSLLFENPELKARAAERYLRRFRLRFGCEPFVLRKGARASFIDTAIDEGKRYEEGAEDLAQVGVDGMQRGALPLRSSATSATGCQVLTTSVTVGRTL